MSGKTRFTEQMQSEFWDGIEYRPVESHSLMYISDSGQLLSFRTKGPGGRNRRSATPHFVAGAHDSDGYLFITRPKKHVHVLVLTAWIGPRPDGKVVRHLNNVRDDNRLSNLAWGTGRENVDDMVKAGSVRGSRNPASKLTEDIVMQMRDAYIHKPLSVIEAAFPQFSKFAIWAAVTGYTWAHLPGAIPGNRRCSKEGWKSGMLLGQKKGKRCA